MRNVTPSRGTRRRGNALIMAVSVTVLLAIIGSSFVIMSRMDRQQVRSVEETQQMDTAIESVIRTIQETLARDVVTNTGLLNGDGSSDKPNEPYDAPTDKDLWLATIEPAVSANSQFPFTWEQASDFSGDRSTWVPAVMRPDESRVADPGHLLGDGNNDRFDDRLFNPSTGPQYQFLADADGDGITDSIWRVLNGVAAGSGNTVYVAVRIIDNSGMLNVNTGLEMKPQRYSRAAGVGDPDSFGEELTQVDWRAIFARQFGSGVYQLTPAILEMKRDEFWQSKFLYNTLPTMTGIPIGGTPTIERVIRAYNAYVIQRLANPSAPIWNDLNGNGVVDLPGELLSGWWQAARPFDLTDELELRNRFFLNTRAYSRAENIASLETSNPPSYPLWQALLGVYGTTQWNTHRALPFTALPDPDPNVADQNRLKTLLEWYQRLMAPNPPVFADGSGNVPLSDQRHLLTGYSWSRAVRPSTDKDDDLNRLVGPARPLDLRRTLVDLLQSDFDPTAPLANLNSRTLRATARIAAAFYAAGFSYDEGVQFAANLKDYYDLDPTIPARPNVFHVTMIPMGILTDISIDLLRPPGTPPPIVPSVNIYGFETQPFITEAVAVVEKNTGGTFSVPWFGVELYNPYNIPIDLTGWALNHKGRDQLYLFDYDMKGEVIQPGERLVIATDAGKVSKDARTIEVKSMAFGDNTKIEAIELGRPLPTPGTFLAVDKVPTLDMQELVEDLPSGQTSETFTIQRGPKGKFDVAKHPATLWMFAQAKFSEDRGPDVALGEDDKPDAPDDDEVDYAYALPLQNTISPLAANFQAMNLPEPYTWHEIVKVLRVGNDDDTVGSGGTGGTGTSPRTISEKIDDAHKSQKYAGEGEGHIRFDFARVKLSNDPNNFVLDRELLHVMAFMSRANDGIDNANEDGDGNAMTYDSLKETRIPGRVNVNTAPLSVLRALVPELSRLDPSIPSAIGTDYPTFSAELAQVIAGGRFDRTGNPEPTPYTNLGELTDWLRTYPDPKGVIDYYMWFPRWLSRNDPAARPGAGDPPWDLPAAYGLGEQGVMGDFEERDWIINRMMNLLTVRSDTFTAYILVRVQNSSNPSKFIERRVVALFDRSNVFLPKGRELTTPWVYTDANSNNRWDPGEPYETCDSNGDGVCSLGEPIVDLNGDGFWNLDDSMEMPRFDPFGQISGTVNPNDAISQNSRRDPNYFDRQYVLPKIVAQRTLPDPR